MHGESRRHDPCSCSSVSHGVKTVRRPLSARWIVALLLLVFALPVVALGISIPIVVERRWERMQAACRNQAAEGRARDPRRTVLRGEPLPGNAWDDYAEAQAMLKAARFPYSEIDYVEHPESIDREAVQVWIEPRLPILDKALRGTRRSECRNPRDWEGPPRSDINPWYLTAPALCRSRQLVEQSCVRSAVELLLDVIRMNGDLARGGTWMRAYSPLWEQRRCLTELKALMATGVLDSDLLRQIARELEILEGDLPAFGEGMLLQGMDIGFQVLRAESVEGYLKEIEGRDRPIPFWQRGDLGRLTLVNWYELHKTTGAKIAEGDAKPWPEASAATREASAELSASGNFFLKLWGSSNGKVDYLPIHRVFRDGLAQMRLLRAAVAYRADGALPDADDPYGGKLRWSKKGHVFRIWSRGVDGMDDGGSGDWNPKSGRDIVLEVRR